ncbi:hypothetical protein OH77DRAFT_696813 [Trametes cingulata]|nr:hypothetical protein OH77DRAFT_696813 [Trametes cingulata]
MMIRRAADPLSCIRQVSGRRLPMIPLNVWRTTMIGADLSSERRPRLVRPSQQNDCRTPSMPGTVQFPPAAGRQVPDARPTPSSTCWCSRGVEKTASGVRGCEIISPGHHDMLPACGNVLSGKRGTHASRPRSLGSFPSRFQEDGMVGRLDTAQSSVFQWRNADAFSASLPGRKQTGGAWRLTPAVAWGRENAISHST